MRPGAKGECRSQAGIRILSCPSPLAAFLNMAWRLIYGRSTSQSATQKFSTRATAEGLHVVELSGGIGLGMLRAALAADYTIKFYTYVDKDIISRKSLSLLSQPSCYSIAQLPASAIHSFDKELPHDISQCTTPFLEQLISCNGPVDLLGGSWECSGVSRAGRQKGAERAPTAGLAAELERR